MKLATKLILAPAAAAAVAMLGGVGTLWVNQQQAAQLRDSGRTALEQAKAIDQAQDQISQVHAGAYRQISIIDSLDDAQLKAFGKSMGEKLAATEKALAAAVAAAPADDELRRDWQTLAPQFPAYQKLVAKALEMGSVDRNMGTGAMTSVDAAHAKLASGLARVAGRLETLRTAQSDNHAVGQQNLMLLIAAIGLLTTAGATFAAWRVQRGIARDLARAAAVSAEVATGNLIAEVHSERADELGDLLRSLDRMAGQLRQTVQSVKDTAESMTTASAEIATGNHDLSQRTEQTAASLQQTAASMTQLTGAVRQSADAAAQASQLAQSAASVAGRGGEVVAQVVTTMDEISASSKRIADIIGTIDGIAFQTNILALNAAVEAARAGEQGRGFAVVAGEVRSLAGRSAEAAREIKRLIGASVDKVESGSRLVQDAGSTMGEIVSSVQRVNDIIAEISAGAGEQRQGIERVNSAVAQLDQMTQQNAALVEQSAAATDHLKSQASSLGQAVSMFRVRGATAPAAPANTPPQVAKAIAVPPASAAASRPAALTKTVVAKARSSAARSSAALPAAAAAPAPAPAAASATGDDWETF